MKSRYLTVIAIAMSALFVGAWGQADLMADPCATVLTGLHQCIRISECEDDPEITRPQLPASGSMCDEFSIETCVSDIDRISIVADNGGSCSFATTAVFDMCKATGTDESDCGDTSLADCEKCTVEFDFAGPNGGSYSTIGTYDSGTEKIAADIPECSFPRVGTWVLTTSTEGQVPPDWGYDDEECEPNGPDEYVEYPGTGDDPVEFEVECPTFSAGFTNNNISSCETSDHETAKDDCCPQFTELEVEQELIPQDGATGTPIFESGTVYPQDANGMFTVKTTRVPDAGGVECDPIVSSIYIDGGGND